MPDPTETHPLVYYITAHGYGHGVRSCDILRRFGELYPDVPLIVVSALPESFLRNRLPLSRPPEFRAASFDVGMVQLDSIRTDVNATLQQAEALCDRWDELVRGERSFLEERGAAVVVADIPAIPLEAAADAGIPAIGSGNFTWNWIYSAFQGRDARWDRVIEMYRDAYARADLLIRLPFHESMDAFERHEDVPLLSRPHTPHRDWLAHRTGADPSKRWVLLSFTTLEWTDAALDRVESLHDYEFFTVRPLAWDRRNIRVVDRDEISFGEVLASADAVVSKPGYGIVSECVVHGKPLVYADRSDFLEYPILVEAIERYLPQVHIPSEDLYAGRVEESLEAVWNRPRPARSHPTGGDTVAAHVLARYHPALRHRVRTRGDR